MYVEDFSKIRFLGCHPNFYIVCVYACFLFIDFVLSVCCFQLVYFKFKLLLFKQAHVHVDIHMHTDIYVYMLILFVILHYATRLQISQSACMAFVCLPN